jgi:GDP-L-fucose synthase
MSKPATTRVSGKRIVVTGATGFLGRNLIPVLNRRYGPEHVVGVCSSDYDLMAPASVRRMFEELEPKIVVHLAAYSGGIGANRAYPADFYFRNTILTALVFDAAARCGVEKLLYTMGGCSYPASARSPIDELQMWDGFPQAESAAYSTAKKMGLVAADAYRRQYGLNAVVLIPGNMYGEYDNFRAGESHVVPAMIRRFFEARVNRAPEVTMWGTGAPTRDFVYAADVAAVVPWFLENFEDTGPVNISSGTTTTIRCLAETVARAVGYPGEVRWDASKPDGQMQKVFDVTRLHALGLSCPTVLHDGLQRTAAWFAANAPSGGEGIRL